MKAAPALSVEENDFAFYNLYQSLPVGAVFVDSKRRFFTANRKMCAYFPMLSGGQEGLPVCQAVRCPKFLNDAGLYGQPCGDCVLYRGLIRILGERKPMAEAKWRYVRRCGERGRRVVRWFTVSGEPVFFLGRRYAALFFNDITEQMLREKTLRKKLRPNRQKKVLNKVIRLRPPSAGLRTENRRPCTVRRIGCDGLRVVRDRYGI